VTRVQRRLLMGRRRMSSAELFGPRVEAVQAWRDAVAQAIDVVARALPSSPVSGLSPDMLRRQVAWPALPAHGIPLAEALRELDVVVQHAVSVGHPLATAHLHPPPLIAALAADVVISAINQSMDSYDQAPSATMIELQLTELLAQLVGLPDRAAGVFTSGATQSNQLSLWMARDAWCAKHGWAVRERGLPPDARQWVILCSSVSHFTIEKAAVQLGLGTDAVVPVAVDADFRMDLVALDAALATLRRDKRIPMAIVATAGTTDAGAIDPIDALADVAARVGAWLHVDAAYAGALLFSRRGAHALRGLARADSVALDLHKLCWQPIACGVSLVRDAAHFSHVTTRADYLNPESHALAGIPDLVDRSLATTRRFDALKLWVSLKTLGTDRLGQMIDRVCALAQEVGAEIEARERLELLHVSPQLSTVLFRVVAPSSATAVECDALQQFVRDRLYAEGRAVIGVTRVHGRSCLKCTLLNPVATIADFQRLFDDIERVSASVATPHVATAR
jgi:L-2,4-diaminobutyrate decarboxylase